MKNNCLQSLTEFLIIQQIRRSAVNLQENFEKVVEHYQSFLLLGSDGKVYVPSYVTHKNESNEPILLLIEQDHPHKKHHWVRMISGQLHSSTSPYDSRKKWKVFANPNNKQPLFLKVLPVTDHGEYARQIATEKNA